MSKSPSAKKKQVHTSKNLKSTFLDRSVKSQKPKRTRSPSGTEDEDEEEEDDLEMDFETLQSTRLRTPKVKPDRLAQLKAQREAKAERARERETTSSAVKKMQRVLDSEEEAEQKRREKKRKKAEKKRWKEREIRERKQMHDIVLDSDQENGDDSGGSSEEEEFIVDDDGDVDQEELDRLLPAQFSSMATQSDRWHHRNFIIMLVTQQLLPRDPVDNKFILSRERCKRLVQDLVDSLVRALYLQPTLAVLKNMSRFRFARKLGEKNSQMPSNFLT